MYSKKASGGGAMDEETFVKAFEKVPKIQVSFI